MRALAGEAQLILVGTVETVFYDDSPDRESDGYIELRPEAFLKGNVTAGMVRFRHRPDDGCMDAERYPRAGDRVLLAATSDTAFLPAADHIWQLEDGAAVSLVRGNPGSLDESRLVAEIRSVTNQYAIPAQSSSESQGIEWWKTVVPVGGAVLAIFIAGLFLMRIWHRIDPS